MKDTEIVTPWPEWTFICHIELIQQSVWHPFHMYAEDRVKLLLAQKNAAINILHIMELNTHSNVKSYSYKNIDNLLIFLCSGQCDIVDSAI